MTAFDLLRAANNNNYSSYLFSWTCDLSEAMKEYTYIHTCSTNLVVDAGIYISVGWLHPEKTSHSQLLGVGRNDLTQAVVVLSQFAITVCRQTGLEFGGREVRQGSAGPLHLYPGQGALPLELDLGYRLERRQRGLGQSQLLF